MNRIQIKARGFTFDAWSAGPKDGPSNQFIEFIGPNEKVLG